MNTLDHMNFGVATSTHGHKVYYYIIISISILVVNVGWSVFHANNTLGSRCKKLGSYFLVGSWVGSFARTYLGKLLHGVVTARPSSPSIFNERCGFRSWLMSISIKSFYAVDLPPLNLCSTSTHTKLGFRFVFSGVIFFRKTQPYCFYLARLFGSRFQFTRPIFFQVPNFFFAPNESTHYSSIPQYSWPKH